MRLAVICSIVVLIVGCKINVTVARIEEIKNKANILLSDIAKGTAEKSFPEKYFPYNETVKILDSLRNNCDFKNRHGGFTNEYYPEDRQSQVSLIYEYYLKCDSIRLILTYNIKDSIELYELKIELLEKYNPMVIESSKHLKH